MFCYYSVGRLGQMKIEYVYYTTDVKHSLITNEADLG